MKMLTVFCLTALASVALVNADNLKSGGFNAYPNTEFGFGSQTVSFGFRGYSEVTGGVKVKLVKVKADGTEDNDAGDGTSVVSTITITGDEKDRQSFMTVAVPSSAAEPTQAEKDQLYAVKFCKDDDTACSELSASGTIDYGVDKQLHCNEVDPAVGQIVAEPLKGYAVSTELGPVSTDVHSTMKIQGYVEGKYRQQKQVGSNWMLYFVFDFSLQPYAALLHSDERNHYCSRKYTVSILTSIINTESKKVEKVFKFTPFLNQELAAAISAKESFPLEVEHIVGENRLKGDKIIWHTLCFTAKDQVGGAVQCTKPFRQTKDVEGKTVDIPWKIDEDTINANGNIYKDEASL